MRTSNVSERLQEIMSARKIRPVDLIAMAKPYCERYGVKLGKNDLSQYISGKVEPGYLKMKVLAKALGVSDEWLYGLEEDDGEA